MKLAVYQGPSPAGATEDGLATLGRMLRAAGAAGARMAVFPEVFLPGYNVADPRPAARSLADWAAVLAPLARAAGCGVTVGVAEREGTQLFNTALALGPDGTLLSQYRKTQLYGPREKRIYVPGSAHAMFDFEGYRIAQLICYDIEFAPLIRDLAGRGAQIILCPTANMQPFAHVARLTVPAQAVNHAVAIAYANYCGSEGDLTYCGGSVLVGADGAVHARAGLAGALLIADLPDPDPALLSTQLSDFRPVE
ncbi:MAG: nitrilase-related carbon-nitrogen hydrolase [Rhodobacterales bacterium]|jgi:predicted amidohydrolase